MLPGGVQSLEGPRCGALARRRLAAARRRLATALRLGGTASRVPRVQHLDLREGASHLLRRLVVEQADDGAHRLDPHPGLLQVALVLLRDPAGGEVDHADHALEQQVLDPDLAQLLLDLLPKLLLARLWAALGRSWRLASPRPRLAIALRSLRRDLLVGIPLRRGSVRRSVSSPRPRRHRSPRSRRPPSSARRARRAPFSSGSARSSPSDWRAGAVHSSSRSTASGVGISSPRSKSIIMPSIPWRIARHRFSSISRWPRGSGSRPSS